MENALVSKLKKVQLDLPPETLSLSRVDVTADLEFDDAALVTEYLRIIKKSRILPHYKTDWFKEKDGKARDCREANRHSYKQCCKQGALFAYDKTAQLQMIDRLPNALIGKRILRIEAQLRRKGILKWVPAAACSSSRDIIHTLFKKGKRSSAGIYAVCSLRTHRVDGMKPRLLRRRRSGERKQEHGSSIC